MAEIDDIINTLIAEALGEGPEGMRRVGETILNRAAIRGINPDEVVRQPHQYTGFSAPGPAAVAAQQNPQVRTAAEAAWELARQPGDPTGGADHYYNPNVVDPGWQNSMQHTGDLGGHTFYRSRQVPAEALARLLAPTAPTPAAQPAAIQESRARNAAMDALRAAPMAAPGIEDMYAGIFAPRSLGDPGAIDSAVGGLRQDPSAAAALASLLTPQRAAPAMPTNVAQSYAGQDGVGPAAQRAASNLFNGDPGMPAAGQTVASFPTAQPARVSASDMARGQGVLSPSSVQAVANMFSGDPGTPARGQTVASIPTVAKTQVSASDFTRGNSGSGIGQPPATRTVASVPVPAPIRQTESRADPVGTAPRFNEIASMFGQNVPGPSGTTAVKTQDRLPATPGPKVNASAPGQALFGGLDPRLAGAAPTPRSASRARAPKPTTKTVTERTVNPAWTAAQKAAKIDPVGDMPSWGDFASTFAPKPVTKMPPQYITRTRQVPATPPPAARASVPFSRPATPAPLRIAVNGGNVQQPQSAPSNWAPQGYTNDGTGKITSNETGGIYYERHLRK